MNRVYLPGLVINDRGIIRHRLQERLPFFYLGVENRPFLDQPSIDRIVAIGVVVGYACLLYLDRGPVPRALLPVFLDLGKDSVFHPVIVQRPLDGLLHRL